MASHKAEMWKGWRRLWKPLETCKNGGLSLEYEGRNWSGHVGLMGRTSAKASFWSLVVHSAKNPNLNDSGLPWRNQQLTRFSFLKISYGWLPTSFKSFFQASSSTRRAINHLTSTETCPSSHRHLISVILPSISFVVVMELLSPFQQMLLYNLFIHYVCCLFLIVINLNPSFRI